MTFRPLHPLDPVFLLKSLLAEGDTGPVPTVSSRLRFTPSPDDLFRLTKYGRVLETPLGVAAGPHSQLSQNIVTAWQAGARFIELKTVQVLDAIDVTKPCIDMRDEGYNCEWSQELPLDFSYREYLKAYVLIHIFRHLWGHDRHGGGEAGFLFNMSAGYDLEGIQSPSMQQFLDRMTDARDDLEQMREILAPVYPAVREIPMDSFLSDSLTVSTMHGCPPEEIEKIGRYFLEERALHTTIKLNPTLLGPEVLRELLNERLGYAVTVPDEAFAHDLKWNDALALIHSLKASAAKAGREFSLKLTNTLECLNPGEALPESEAMIYMSGRALHPLAIALGAKLQEAFGGELDISFSAGVAAESVADSLACGLAPLTVCSDLLKPGGYTRLYAMLHEVREAMDKTGAGGTDDFIRRVAGMNDVAAARMRNLSVYAEKCARSDGPFAKKARVRARPLERELPRFDCAAAPCREVCPSGQFQPDYLGHYRIGNAREARLALLLGNPLHHLQAAYCDNLCGHKCEKYCFRSNADFPLRIQAVRALIQAVPPPVAPMLTDGRAALIRGDGVAGLVCAFWLNRAGLPVLVEESSPEARDARKESLGKVLWESLQQDISALRHRGVTFVPTVVRIPTPEEGGAEGLALYITADAVDYPEEPTGAEADPGAGILKLWGMAATGKPNTMTAAVREGQRTAGLILQSYGLPLPSLPPRAADIAFGHRKGGTTSRGPLSIFTASQARAEAHLCLQCDLVCGVCVNVCPNRANFSVPSPKMPVPVPLLKLVDGNTVVENGGELKCTEIVQILHLRDLCNKCGNCATFCPSSGEPYRAKTRLFLSREAFDEALTGYYLEGKHALQYKEPELQARIFLEGNTLRYEDDNAAVDFDPARLTVLGAALKPGVTEIIMERAAETLLVFLLTDEIRQLI